MRAERLRRTKDIEAVRAAGALTVDPHFTIRAKPNGMGVVRVAVASPRAIGSAVRRNRARRRVREAIRSLLQGRKGAAALDLLVTARSAAVAAAPEQLRQAVAVRLDALLGADHP